MCRVARSLAWVLAPLYVLGVWLKNASYDLRLLKARRLSWPVVSVGNVSVGGTGKTPLVLLLAELLAARGWTADVLSRGYGRGSGSVVRVDPQGGPEEFGDEPLLMARCGISVYVGADRFQAGLLAEEEAHGAASVGRQRRLHLLDDGLQHRKLARAVEIVLVRRADFEDHLLPVGRLREPLRALRRADICVLRAEDADLKEHVLHCMGRSDPERVWILERRTVLPPLPQTQQRIEKALAFCAIGDPQGFFDGLRAAGVEVKETIACRDHHAYTRGDVARIQAAARESGAQCLLTTEKDGVRLAGGLRAELEAASPLLIAGLQVTLLDEAGSMAVLESLLSAQATGTGTL